MSNIPKNIIAPFGLGIVALIFLLGTVQLPFGTLDQPGSGFTPAITAFLLLALCIIIMVKEVLLRSKNSIKEDSPSMGDFHGESTNTKRPIKMIAVMAVYLLVLKSLGFLLSSILLIFVALRLMEYRSWWFSLVMSLLLTLGTWYLFGEIFGVRFPAGIFS